MKESFLIAKKFLFPHNANPSNAQKSMIGTVICIALSLIPLLVVMVVSTGVINGITEKLVSLSSFDIQVTFPYSGKTSETDYEFYQNYAQKYSSLPHVKSATVERQVVVLASGKNGRCGATVRGVDSDIFKKNENFRKNIKLISGNFDLSKANSAVLGEKLASNLSLKVGDTVRIVSSQTENGKTRPSFSLFKVTGIVSSGYQEMDSFWFFVPAQTAFKIFSKTSSRIFIGLETDCTFDYALFDVCAQVENCSNDLVSVYTWQEINKGQMENFSSTKLLLILIMGLIVLVALINVSSSIVMLVMEKKKEIAILKSVGMSKKEIVFIFLLIAFAIGFFAVLIGLPLSLLCIVNVNEIIMFIEKILNVLVLFVYNLLGEGANFSKIYLLNSEFYLDSIPIVLSFWQIFVIVLLVLLLSVIVSIIPSVKAANEKPLSIFHKA